MSDDFATLRVQLQHPDCIAAQTPVDDLLDDLEEERELISNLEKISLPKARPSIPSGAHGKLGDESMSRIFEAASKSINERTDASYTGLRKGFNKFCIDEGLIGASEDIFTMKKLNPRVDCWIIGWIMKSCDDVDIHGTAQTGPVGSWSQVMKMRSAMTQGFGVIGKRGNTSWDSENGTGNPSLSMFIAGYIRGLHRRKVQQYGEAPASARAITSETLKMLYAYNNQSLTNPPVAEDNWCGPMLRIALHAIYTLAFCCLLRVDEVLNIQAHDLKLEKDDDGAFYLELHLNFRKTHQFEEIQPFIIREFPTHLRHLCPVRAVTKWLRISSIHEGYIFRRMSRDHEPVVMKPTPMTPTSFINYFRNNLLDIGVENVHSYGSHSFRRGGCQWLSVGLRWPLRQICEYGGWSTDFSYLTIVKYLISWTDEPSMPRRDFFNFSRAPSVKCPSCNRSCHCA